DKALVGTLAEHGFAEQAQAAETRRKRGHRPGGPVRPVVEAGAHLAPAKDELDLRRQSEAVVARYTVDDRVGIEIVPARREMEPQRNGAFSLRLRVLGVDAPDVDDVGRAEEVAHTPVDRLLP